MGHEGSAARSGGEPVMEPAHLLGTGGAIGAVFRYVIGQRLVHERFPSPRWR